VRRLGAVPCGDGLAELCVWAPVCERVSVRAREEVQLERDGECWVGRFGGDDYLLVADGEAHPDPCSRWQPEGVSGPSRVLDTDAFEWSDDDWDGVALDELVLYELHVGTFSEEGTFDGVIPRLAGLRELGVTAIELMPVSTFPGNRGWGYDGLYTYAAHPAYGGPFGLARLVDAAHAEGLAVILDVVYNHVGPGDEWGHDAQWADRAHHELHVLLTGEHEGYYAGYGSLASLADDLRGRGREPRRSVICAQNHDQVGNRALGDRLPEDALRVAAAVTLFSPCTPLLFMGEERFETAPFQFFTDHIDPAIADATREGRKREFAEFAGFTGEEVADPQALETFLRSKLQPGEPDPLYRELLALRRGLPRELEADAREEAKILRLRRGEVTLVADFANRRVEVSH
jgi:1,4-alpha-glucan branching enzyme